jgi:hypothetical protein
MEERMRTEFIRADYRYQAQEVCPWAVKIAHMDNGFMCFEHIDDYILWRQQKADSKRAKSKQWRPD